MNNDKLQVTILTEYKEEPSEHMNKIPQHQKEVSHSRRIPQDK